MTNISGVTTAANKELKHGQLIYQPIVAWAFDMSRTQVQPDPVAIGGYAKFLENKASAALQLIPANPGFFQMTYLVDCSRELLQRLTPELRAEIKKTAGAFELGVWGPEDSTDWLALALECEHNIFEELVLPIGEYSMGDARSC